MTKPARNSFSVLTSGLYVVGSLFVLLVFLVKPGINHYPPSLLGKTIDGTAHKPYVLRALVPVTIRVVATVVPESIRSDLISDAKTSPLRDVLQFLDGIPPELCVEFLIACLIMWGALLGFLLALRDLFDALFDAPREFADNAPLLALLLLPPFFRYTSFVYDFPALFFFTLGLSLMIRRRWTVYLLVFSLSCLNKETTILLALVFWLNFKDGELPRPQFRRLLFSQVGVWIALKGALGLIYRSNAGGAVEYHLLDHNIDLIRPYDPATAVAYLVLLLLATYRWTEKPAFLRRALWIAVPLFGLTLFLGFFDELRDYYELFPILLLLVAHSFGNIIGLDVKTRTRPLVAAPSAVLRVPRAIVGAAAAAVAALLAGVAVAKIVAPRPGAVREAALSPTAIPSPNRPIAVSLSRREAFAARLSGETPSSAWIEYDARDAGARQLAEELGAGFEAAHWKVRALRPSALNLRPGVMLLVADDSSRTTKAVSEALTGAEVRHSEAEGYRAYGERRKREEPNWQGPVFGQDQEFLLVVGRGAQ